MPLPRVLSSLKFRIVVLAVITGVFAALATAKVVLDVTEVQLQQQLLANDRADRERTASLLSSKLETLKDTLVAAARQSDLALLQGSARITQFLLNQPALGALFDNILVAGADGDMLAHVSRGAEVNELPNLSDRAYFRQVMQSDQPVVSEPLLSKIHNRPVVVVAVPIIATGGQTIGMLAGMLRLGSHSLFTEPLSEREDGVRDLVMARSGVILSHSDASRVMSNARSEPGFSTVFTRWQEAGSPIDTQATAELSQDQLVSQAGIPFSDWALVRLTPRAKAFAPLEAAQHAVWAAAGGAGVAAGLLAGLLAWVTVSPITQLRNRAERLLADDDASTDGWPQRAGEVGEMSLAFQQLLQQRDQQRRAAREVTRQLQAVLDNAEVGIVLTRNGRFETVSPKFCAVFQFEQARVLGALSSLMFPSAAAYEAFSERAEPAFMDSGRFEGEVELKRQSGEIFWAHMRGRAMRPGDRSQGTIWVITDVAQAYRQRESLSRTASHDGLTGLVNRVAFESLLTAATGNARAQPFCALFIDLDRFKQVNDGSGHAAGDALLKGIAQTLAGQLRKSDTVARLGGDEFAVLLPECPTGRAQAIAEQLCSAVETYALEWEGTLLKVGASIGMVACVG